MALDCDRKGKSEVELAEMAEALTKECAKLAEQNAGLRDVIRQREAADTLAQVSRQDERARLNGLINSHSFDIHGAIAQAREAVPDYPWSQNTAREAAYAMSQSIKGLNGALEDWRTEYGRLRAALDAIKADAGSHTVAMTQPYVRHAPGYRNIFEIAKKALESGIQIPDQNSPNPPLPIPPNCPYFQVVEGGKTIDFLCGKEHHCLCCCTPDIAVVALSVAKQFFQSQRDKASGLADEADDLTRQCKRIDANVVIWENWARSKQK